MQQLTLVAASCETLRDLSVEKRVGNPEIRVCVCVCLHLCLCVYILQRRTSARTEVEPEIEEKAEEVVGSKSEHDHRHPILSDGDAQD